MKNENAVFIGIFLAFTSCHGGGGRHYMQRGLRKNHRESKMGARSAISRDSSLPQGSFVDQAHESIKKIAADYEAELISSFVLSMVLSSNPKRDQVRLLKKLQASLIAQVNASGFNKQYKGFGHEIGKLLADSDGEWKKKYRDALLPMNPDNEPTLNKIIILTAQVKLLQKPFDELLNSVKMGLESALDQELKILHSMQGILAMRLS